MAQNRWPSLVLTHGTTVIGTLWVLCIVVWSADSPRAAASVARPQVPALVGPASAGDGVALAYGDSSASHMAFYEANTGRVRWRRDFKGTSFVWGLAAYGDRLYAPTFRQGVLVLAAHDGNTVGRLSTGRDSLFPQVGCTARYVFVTTEGATGRGVVAFDPKALREIWRRVFAGREVVELRPAGDAVELLLYERKGDFVLNARRVSLRAKDGRTLATAPAQSAPDYEPLLKTLPPAAQQRLREILERKEGAIIVRLPHTQILSDERFVFVGTRYVETPPSTLFAIDNDTGRVVWKQAMPGLSDIALAGGRLIASCELPGPWAESSAKSLVGLDAQSGRILWTVKLESPQRAR